MRGALPPTPHPFSRKRAAKSFCILREKQTTKKWQSGFRPRLFYVLDLLSYFFDFALYVNHDSGYP